MIRIVTTFILIAAALPAFAQPLGADGETDWFTVELVVFEQAGDRGVPAPEPYVPETDDAVNLARVFGDQDFGDGPSGPLLPLPDALRFLPPPEDTEAMAETWQRLERSARYRPILRQAWRQRVGAFSNPLPVRVRGGEVLGYREADEAQPSLAPGGTLPAAGLPESADEARASRAINEIDGSVALVRGRYLHLNVDLVFRERDAALVTRATSPAFAESDAYAAFPSWRITERREIRPGQLHYFDHRRFGVIAVARPWLAPEDDSESRNGEDGGGIPDAGPTDTTDR